METINIQQKTKILFEKIRFNLRVKEKKFRTQDEVLIILINKFKQSKK